MQASVPDSENYYESSVETGNAEISVATTLLARELILVKRRRVPVRMHSRVLWSSHQETTFYLGNQMSPVSGKRQLLCSPSKRESESPGNHRTFSLTLVHGKIMEEILLKAISGNSQIRSAKGNLYLTNLSNAISSEMTSTVDEEKAENDILLYFSKALIVSHSLFVAKLRICGLDK